MVKVDVSDERNLGPGADLLECFAGGLVRHGDAHDVAAGLRELFDLGHSGVHVAGVRDGHRLHRDGRAAADGHIAHLDLKRAATSDHPCTSSGSAATNARLHPPGA